MNIIIDIHNHPDWHGHYVFERFIENMKQYHIDKTWLLSWETPRNEYNPESLNLLPGNDEDGPIPFSACRRYMEKAPERFILGYAPDPRKPEAIDRLDYAIHAYGVRVYGELKLRMAYDNPDALRMFRYCGKMGLPVLVHIDYEFDTGKKYPRPNWWYGGGISAFERAINACPETTFIGHAPGFWSHISGDNQYNKTPYPSGGIKPGGRLIEMLEQYPNLYCDMSAGSGYNALSRDIAFSRQFLIQYQDRVLYGRDLFDNRHQELLNSLELPEAALEKIYSGNALNIINKNSD